MVMGQIITEQNSDPGSIIFRFYNITALLLLLLLLLLSLLSLLLSVPLLYHSMGQIIKFVVYCIYVCVCLWHTVAFFNQSSRNLTKTSGVRKGRTDWGRYPKMPSPILTQKQNSPPRAVIPSQILNAK